MHHSSPFLLVLIHAVTSWSYCNNQQQTTDDRQCLEEVVLEEVVHRVTEGEAPPSIHVEIDQRQPDAENNASQLRLVTNGNQNNQCQTDRILHQLQKRNLKTQQREKHEDQKHSAAQLHVSSLLGVLAERWQTSKDIATGGLSLTLSQQ